VYSLTRAGSYARQASDRAKAIREFAGEIEQQRAIERPPRFQAASQWIEGCSVRIRPTAQEKSAKRGDKHLQLQDRDRETALREILRDNPQIEIIRFVIRRRFEEDEYVPTRVRCGYVK